MLDRGAFRRGVGRTKVLARGHAPQFKGSPARRKVIRKNVSRAKQMGANPVASQLQGGRKVASRAAGQFRMGLFWCLCCAGPPGGFTVSGEGARRLKRQI
jgi:hypothetical protein